MSYPDDVTRAAADTYWAARGVLSWATHSEELRDGAVQYSKDYVSAFYTECEPVPDPTPDEVAAAHYELARWNLEVWPISQGLATPPGGVAVTKKKLGPMEKSYQPSSSGATMSGQEFERYINALLEPYFCQNTPTGRSLTVGRLVRT